MKPKFYIDPLREADWRSPTHPRPVLFCNLWMEPPGPTKPLRYFAHRIKVERANFCNYPGSVPHFRLTVTGRKRAAGLGAIEVGNRAILRALVAWRRYRGETIQESKCCFAGVTESGGVDPVYFICNNCLEPCDLI